jgi:hypothetical protein
MISTAFAQSTTERATIGWGAEMTDPKDGYFNSIFGYSDDHVFMTVTIKRERFIRKMDQNHGIVYQDLLPLTIDKVKHELNDILLVGDRILVFTEVLDKKAGSNNMYLRAFRASDMDPIGSLQLVSSMDIADKRQKGTFEVRISPDEAYVLIMESLPNEKDAPERFGLKVYDRGMNLVWNKSVELPYRDNEFSMQGIHVTDDGSVMIIGLKYAENREAKELKKDGKATYVHHMLIYHADGGTPEDHAIDIPDKFLQDLTLNIGTDGDILCGGLYGKKGSFTASGAYFLRMDRTTKKIVHASYKEFDQDFITAFMTEKEEAKASKQADKEGEDIELYSYELRDIIRRNDGGAVMVAEQYRKLVVERCKTDANGLRDCTTSAYYHYYDIIVVSIDPQGMIAWAAKVPKRQWSVDDNGRYSSYALVVKQENIYLMFNDSGKNLALLPGDKIEYFKIGQDVRTRSDRLVTLATINADGKVFREALLPLDKRDAVMLPKKCVQVGDDRLFIYAEWKDKHRFGTVTFQ